MTPEQIHALVLAVDQCLDDMGDIGTSVCGLAKAQLRIAFEPFIGGDIEPPKYTLEAAVAVQDEDENFYRGDIPPTWGTP